MRVWMRLLAVCCIGAFIPACLGQVTVLVDHVGYETRAPKQALILGTEQDHPQQFSLIDSATGKSVLDGSLTQSGKVDNWKGRVFCLADFSS